MTKRRRATVTVLLAAGVFALAGCGDAADHPDNALGQSQTPTGSAMQSFLEQCERGVAEWSGQGQVDYPEVLRLELDRAGRYAAAVDVRDRPAPPEDLVPDGTSEEIRVKCIVGARLLEVDDDIVQITVPDTAGDGGWVYREFTPTGVLQWSWSVTATRPRDTEVTLELRPSIRRDDDGTIVANAEETTLQHTRVEVSAGMVQRAGSWVDENQGYVALLAVAAGSALVWALKSIADVREEGRRAFPTAFRRRRRDTDSSAPS